MHRGRRGERLPQRATLYYGVRDDSVLAYADKFDEWSKNFNVDVVTFFSEAGCRRLQGLRPGRHQSRAWRSRGTRARPSAGPRHVHGDEGWLTKEGAPSRGSSRTLTIFSKSPKSGARARPSRRRHILLQVCVGVTGADVDTHRSRLLSVIGLLAGLPTVSPPWAAPAATIFRAVRRTGHLVDLVSAVK